MLLAVKERKRRTQEDMSTEPASAPEPEHNQSPQPAYPAKIIYQFPEEKPAPLSELEICALCFPHQVCGCCCCCCCCCLAGCLLRVLVPCCFVSAAAVAKRCCQGSV